MVSKNYSIKKSSVNLNNIIQNSIEMLMIENIKEKIDYEKNSNKKLEVDFELFSLALKNLLDNGIKYSIDKKVKIVIDENIINIISKGPSLEKPLNSYFEPYHNDIRNKNYGMGLGLYIVYEILNMHNMKLDYLYVNGINIFKIEL